MKTTSDEIAILEKVRHEPYFSLRVIPDGEIERLSAEAAKKFVFDNKASLRGWDFPHVDLRKVYKGHDYLYSVIDWHRHLELWRIYFSGQFVYIGNLWDVLPEFQSRLRSELEEGDFDATKSQKDSVVGVTSFVGLIYSITEFYVFTARLSLALGLKSVQVQNTLHNVEGWILGSGEPMVGWYSFFQCKTRDINLNAKMTLEELTSDPTAAARNSIKRLFEGFNWLDASPQMIRGWQDKLMSGRFAF